MQAPVTLQAEILSGEASRAADSRLSSRIATLRAALSADLEAIEGELTRAADIGPDPGRSAARHLVQHGGKRIRPMAVLLAARCFGPVPDAARSLAVVVELVHTATLLHDDVIDEGDERRGAPAARKIWGNAVSVLGGDLALVSALERTAEAAPSELPGLLETLRKLVEGEIIQLRGRKEICLDEDTYFEILRLKTASLFGWAAAVGASSANAPPPIVALLRQFGEALGVAFQLVDDVIDYAGDRSGKTLFTDLREGKVTLPLVVAVNRVPALAELVRRVAAGDEAALEMVAQKVVASGACDEVRRRAQAATDRAISALDGVPRSAARELLGDAAKELAGRVR